jgi:transposase, IS5 family
MSGQLGFADHVVVSGRSRRTDHLGQITGLIDWSAIEALLRPLRRGRLGRPPYPVLMLFKMLLLQRWYALSDEAMEDALVDRLSFRRFVGLGLEESIPDASTLCRFRCDMAAAKLGEAVFLAAGQSLAARGMIVREGTLIDASLIPAAVAEPRKQPGGGVSAVDPEAVWAKKGSKAVFGYKLHIAVDKGSLLIRAARLTPANVADCTLGPDLVQGDEAAVYGDMGYDNAALRDRLAAGGIANQVMQRPNRHHRLSEEAIARNIAIGRIRGRVEGLFGTFKRSYGRQRLLYVGLAKNSLDVFLTLLAINLRRARTLAYA